MVVFKTSKLLLTLFQIDGSINEMFFWPKLLFFKDFSKIMGDLVFYVILEEKKADLHRMVKTPSNI